MTPKQQLFVEEYLIDLNATQAAIRAGYSAKTAHVIGHENLNKPEIAAAVGKAQADRNERTRVDADWVLRRFTEEADADVGDLYDETGRVKPIHDWPPIWRKGLVASIESFPEKVGIDDNGEPILATAYKIRFADRTRIKELLGKHVYVSAFREQVDHTSSDGSMSPPSLAEFYGKPPAKADAG